MSLWDCACNAGKSTKLQKQQQSQRQSPPLAKPALTAPDLKVDTADNTPMVGNHPKGLSQGNTAQQQLEAQESQDSEGNPMHHACTGCCQLQNYVMVCTRPGRLATTHSATTGSACPQLASLSYVCSDPLMGVPLLQVLLFATLVLKLHSQVLLLWPCCVVLWHQGMPWMLQVMARRHQRPRARESLKGSTLGQQTRARSRLQQDPQRQMNLSMSWPWAA